MTASPPRLRLDERAVSAGTTVRFALLLVLLLVSGSSMIISVATRLQPSRDLDGFGCELAAGADPLHAGDLATVAVAAAQKAAYQSCVDRYGALPPWWLAAAAPLLLLTAAGLVFALLPLRKARRGRVVPLAAVDRDGGILHSLTELSATAGLSRPPRFVVDPTAATVGAVVFGRTGRATVCLHGGLLAHRTTDPDGFRAVVLHELAHVHNRDVSLTYFTVALWRVFVALALLPELVVTLREFTGRDTTAWASEAPGATRRLLLTVVMVALVHLARSDVLRSREIYADLAAVRWGAAAHTWAVPDPAPPTGRAGRAWASFAGLWRTHPRWDLRRESLTDPAALFAVRALPMLLTGAAAILIDVQSADQLGNYVATGRWARQALASAPAGLVTGVAGIMLWRAVVHATATGRPAPAGVRAGLWLGVGMAAAELVLDDLTGHRWLPERPEVMLLLVLAGVAFGWWVTSCARLWTAVWQRPTVRAAMLLCLAAASLAMSAWFFWWQGEGTALATGWPTNPAATYHFGNALDRAAPTQPLMALQTLSDGPVALPAVAALWGVPLLAWAVRPAPGQATGGALPSLRRLLLAAAGGGVLGWAGFVAVMAGLHGGQPTTGDAWSILTATYFLRTSAALVLAMAAAAAIATASAGRHRLIAAIVAAESAAFVAAAGMFVLASAEGCVRPLSVVVQSCVWRPGPTWSEFRYLLGPVLVAGAGAAFAVAAVAAAIRRVRRPAPRRRTAAGRTGPARFGVPARRVGIGVLCAAAAASTWLGPSAQAEGSPRPEVAPDLPVVSAETRAMQVTAWTMFGGADLLHRLIVVTTGFGTLLQEGNGRVDTEKVRPFCADIAEFARTAAAYLRIPDPSAQDQWQAGITQAEQSGRDCTASVDGEDGKLLAASFAELLTADSTLNSAYTRIVEVAHAGGL
ncbi:M56 family metallopeptidase [Kitasatospora sp. NPDC002227]|uniref:M56 family metallopeptidase n=1 Tax=Kitasatospora sp. NPDC002227 TaxID=3154773 RepID=UPI00332DA5A9